MSDPTTPSHKNLFWSANNIQRGIYQQTAKFYSLLYVPQIAIMLIQVGQDIRQKAKLNKIKVIP